MDIEKLKLLIFEYLQTLDNDGEHEWYTTDYNFAKEELEGFVEWLEKNNAQQGVNPTLRTAE